MNMRNPNHKKQHDAKAQHTSHHSKNIKHDPQAESARAVFGLKGNLPQEQGKDKS